MKKKMAALLAGAMLIMATSAMATPITLLTSDQYYVGSTPGSPSSPSDELGYLTNLINYANGGANPGGGYALSITDSSLLPLPSTAGFTTSGTNETGPLSLTAGSMTYILVKYSDVDYVWDVAGLTSSDSITIPGTLDNGSGKGFSHYDLFGSGTPDPGPDPVPEPGTIMLLGAGLLGLAVYGKRRKNA